MVANSRDFDFYGAGGTNGLLLGTTSKTTPANYRVRTQPLAGLPGGPCTARKKLALLLRCSGLGHHLRDDVTLGLRGA